MHEMIRQNRSAFIRGSRQFQDGSGYNKAAARSPGAVHPLQGRHRESVRHGELGLSSGADAVHWFLTSMDRLGGHTSLGVLDLTTLGYALRLRWEWLACTEPDRLWAKLPSRSERIVKATFELKWGMGPRPCSGLIGGLTELW
jgi:hypothetical protein